MLERNYGALFYETGTGKTPVGLEIIAQLYFTQGYRKFLVVCPNNAPGHWLQNALDWHLPLRVSRSLHADRARKLKALAGDWEVFAINWEALRLMTPEIRALHLDCIIFDEIHKVKNPTAKSTAAAHAIAADLVRRGRRVYGLTGTPEGKNPLDLWSIFDVLQPSVDGTYNRHPLGYGSYAAYEASVCTKIPHPRVKGIYLYKFPDDKLREIKSRVAVHAREALKKDCLDLPPEDFRLLHSDMLPEQKAVYDALRADMVAFVEKAEAYAPDGALKRHGLVSMADVLEAMVSRRQQKTREPWEKVEKEIRRDLLPGEDQRVSVTLTSVLLTRLQQIAAGHVVTDDKTLRTLPCGKVTTLEQHLPAWADPYGDHKVIVFTRFKHDQEIVSALCEKLKIGYVRLDGKNSREATAVAASFQKDARTRLFLGNIQCASEALNLTAADYVCFYTNTFNWINREQAVARPQRIGQTRSVTYYDLLAIDSVDYYILENLAKKTHLITMSVKGLKDVLSGNIPTPSVRQALSAGGAPS